MAILLRNNDVQSLVSIQDAIAAIRQGLLEQAAGQVQLPPRITVDSTNGWLRTMPVIINRSGYMGLKVMHSTNGVGVGYIVALYDLHTGRLLAFMDADWLTVLRTAATTAVGTDYLAPQRVEQMALLGTGEQARIHLQAMAATRELGRVKVFSRDAGRRQSFAAEMSRELDCPVEPVERPESAVAGSQLVMVAIRAGREPALLGNWLERGQHVNGISSVRSEAREIDHRVWQLSDLVVVDDREHVLESGDGRNLLERAPEVCPRLWELWEVAAGRRPGRDNDQQITLFKSVGTGLQDLALAAMVYQKARERSVGLELGDFPYLKPPSGAAKPRQSP